MATRKLKINVVQAAEQRILQTFKYNPIVICSFSGGKDSLVLLDMTIKTMQKYNIDFSRLVVIFFDEEAIYPDVEEITMRWREKVISLGAKFIWFCLPVKHFNACNQLKNDETFICWEKGKEDVWIRDMPKFAIREHALFRDGMSYQEFSYKAFKDFITLSGVRVYESYQRRTSFIRRKSGVKDKGTLISPLYDWKDNDIWLYLYKNNINIPVAYLNMYKVGVHKNKMRISQFFSIDTIKTLGKLMEYYPDLYERILKREPNAYLVSLYYETELFRSSKQSQQFQTNIDYKKKVREEMKLVAQGKLEREGYSKVRGLLFRMSENVEYPTKIWRTLYGILVAGDPKYRTVRAILKEIYICTYDDKCHKDEVTDSKDEGKNTAPKTTNPS